MKFILLFLFSCPFFAGAQDKVLVVEGTSPDLYLSHTVAVKENFYSIGRLYNISPKEIAPFNKLQLEKGLNPGQVIKIPLGKSNFFQSGTAADDEAMIPLYHTVQEKEGLYRIGINHNKLPVETLKKWNHIKADAVSKGTKLIIGYLKVKKDQSALTAKAEKTKPVVVTEEKKPVISNADTIKTTVKELPPVKKEENEKPVVKEEEKKEVIQPKENAPVVPQIISGLGTDHRGGVFKSLFDSQTNDNAAVQETGTAGVFKSTSGWTDGKYYCLHNNAAAGTIIKITNTATGKSVYAKVLDVIPDIKQNNGMLIRISNAAADELGAGEINFNCTLNYSK